MRNRRTGASLVEVLIALVLGVFVVQLGFATLGQLDRFAADASKRSDVAMSIRIARSVLRDELAVADSARAGGVAGDSVALRAFRGVGVVCPGSISGSTVLVAYAGARQPDSTKDSLEVITASGRTRVIGFDVVSASAALCATRRGAEVVQLWTAATPVPPDALLLRPFERGSYHLAGSALRYRAGRGGRQPLTPEVFDDGRSWIVDSADVIAARLTPIGGTRGWTGTLLRRSP